MNEMWQFGVQMNEPPQFEPHVIRYRSIKGWIYYT